MTDLSPHRNAKHGGMQTPTIYAASLIATAIVGLAVMPAQAQDSRFAWPRMTILSPTALECIALNEAGRSEIHVRNSLASPIQAGRKIGWKASRGQRGVWKLAAPLEPGTTVQIGRSKHSTDCSAWLMRSKPVLSR